MANPNAPFGFRAVSRVGGSPFSLTTYGKPSTDSQAIFQGDLVIKVTGTVPLPENTSYNVPTIQSGYASQSTWVGVAQNYGAASTATVHQVYDEIDMIFIVQGKTGTTYSMTSHVGKNANMSTTTAGSTTTKQSGMSLDGATIATTNTLDLRIRNVAMISPNVEGANNIFEVTINKHIYANQVAGV